MTIIVNGKSLEIAPAATLAELLERLELNLEQVVIERNGSIVARHNCAAQRLEDGDKLEIIHFVGGG